MTATLDMQTAEPASRVIDTARLAVLARYDILDTPPEAAFDALATLAADLCMAPIGLVTFVDDTRQFFKASSEGGVSTAPLDVGFCPEVVAANAPLTIRDTLADPAYAQNPAALAKGVRFYAGVPLSTSDGHVLGTLCVLDTEPRPGLTDRQARALKTAADQVIAQLELRRALKVSEAALLQQRLLADELTHRMKNTLAMVQAIVSQALRPPASLEEARRQVSTRLVMLGRAQDTLTRSGWAAAPLVEIVHAGLDVAEADRIEVDGPDVAVGARAALSLTLVLYELVTNATKYGALSTPEGRVAVAWRVEADGGVPRLVLSWVERGGPKVSAPERRGFGSRLLRSVMDAFGGEGGMSYDPDGVRWTLRASLEALSAG